MKSLFKNSGSIGRIFFSRDGSNIFVGCNGQLHRFLIEKEGAFSRIGQPEPFKMMTIPAMDRKSYFTLNGTALNRIRRTDFDSGEVLDLGYDRAGSIGTVSVSPSGNQLCVTRGKLKAQRSSDYRDNPGYLEVWHLSEPDVEVSPIRSLLKRTPKNWHPFTKVAAISADGKRVLTRGPNSLVLWNAETMRPIKSYQAGEQSSWVGFGFIANSGRAYAAGNDRGKSFFNSSTAKSESSERKR